MRSASRRAATFGPRSVRGARAGHSAPLWVLAALAILMAVLLLGCAAQPARERPLPPTLGLEARVPDIPHARQWGDEVPAAFDAWLALPSQMLRARYGGIMDRPHDYLVISGGGSDGAFGAGLLVGWSEQGSRPEFQVVTGISAGAMIAPFAFLGSDYDQVLREVYTGLSTDDIIERRNLLTIIRGDSVVDPRPLRRLIAKYLDDDLIAAIAAEGSKGRSLLIGTTNLDAGRPVIWDITRIAASTDPSARELTYDVILASASIPGAFPPVLIEVEAADQRYQELHVDGGVTAQLFLSPAGLDWSRVRQRLGIRGKPDLYIIRNAKLRPDWETVPLRLAPLITRTISTLIRTQGIGDLAQIYLTADRHELSYHLAAIPLSFSAESAEPFDRRYMERLFRLGYAQARQGYPWIRPGRRSA